MRTANEAGSPAPRASAPATGSTSTADAPPAPPPTLTTPPVDGAKAPAHGSTAAATDGPGTGSTPPDLGPAPVPAAAPARSGGGGFLGTVLGGLIAAAIGFGVALFLFPDGFRPTGPEPVALDPAPPAGDGEARLDALAQRLDDLGLQLDAVSSQPADQTGDDLQALAQTTADAVSEVDQRLADLETQVADIAGAEAPDLTTDLSALSDRIDALEADDGDAGAEAAMAARLESFRSELDQVVADARAEMDAAQADARQALEDAQANAARAEAATALSRIETALATGEPYAEPLAALEASTEVPAALSGPAAEGVPSLAALRSDYPDAARAALAAAPGDAAPEEGFGGRFGAFLRSQTNARSLSPQEGDGADAVLSRAEAALNEGDLGTALTELDTLPEQSRSAMDDWISRARTRQDALAAAADVSGSIDGS